MVGSLLHRHGEELDLVLLVVLPVEREVAHLRVSVLDLTASLRDVLHALSAEVAALGIGGRLMVATLILGGEHSLIVADDIVLELAHSLELHACDLLESLGSLMEGMLGRGSQRMAVLVEEGAEHGDRGNLGEGIEEGGAETWQDIEVARPCLYEGEETGAVDALATGEYGVEIVEVVDDEVERLQPSVATRVHEVHHVDVVVDDVADDVVLGKLG